MISVFINSMTSGGAEKVVLSLIDRFKSKNDDLELILIEKERFYDLPENVPANYLTTYESLENSPLKFPYLFVCAWRLKQSVQHEGQIVQSHLLRASFINVIAKWMGSPHHAQIVVHSRINFDHKAWPVRQLMKWLYKKIFNGADSVISICETMKLELDDYLNLKHHPKHLAIHNPHDLDAIQQKAKEETTDFTFDPSKQYLISVGRLVKGKRVDDLLQAFANLSATQKNVELIILGDGNLREELEQLAQSLNINHRVHFVGFQQNPFVYIARSTIMVLSSEWEGLPNIIIEAMACGTAVLSSDCISGPREIIHPSSDLRAQLKEDLEHGECGLLYPVGRVDLLTKGLTTLLNQDELRQSLVEKGKKRAQDFNQSKIAEKYLQSF